MIRRDGNSVSLWQNTVEPYLANNRADHNTVYDVAIVGGGITGITTALLLQEAGKKCIVFEAETLCFGTTGGTTAHLNTLLDTPYSTISKKFNKETAGLVATATADAIALVKKNIEKYNIDCDFEDADAYLFAKDEKQEEQLDEIQPATEEAGLKVENASTIPVNIPFKKAIRVEGQAKFHPAKYVHALAKAFENAGGIIVQQCRVLGVNENQEAEIETSDGLFKSKLVVYATHIPPGVNLIHLRCAPYRSYAMAVELNNEQYPASLCYDLDDPYHYYRTHTIDGRKYLVAGGYDHKTAHEENTQKQFMELEAHIRTYFPVKTVTYRWSSQYFEPADGLPYIGRLPGHTDLMYVASGFGGNGMTYSQVAALVLKSILLNEELPYQDIFNPSRIKPVAGFKNFITHNADLVKQFANKFFHREKLEELADIAPGEGKVVTFEGKKIAIHKDEEGHLHAISPVCTHFKCNVAWNMVEGSWDCPCHGARYSYDGEVLTGPATIGLEKISIMDAVLEK